MFSLSVSEKTSAWSATMRRTHTGLWLVHGPGRANRKRCRGLKIAEAERVRRGKDWRAIFEISQREAAHVCTVASRGIGSQISLGLRVHTTPP